MGQERLGPSYFFIPLVLGPLNSLVWYVPSSRYTRGLGWRMHCGVEVTESSTNKQHHLSRGDRHYSGEIKRHEVPRGFYSAKQNSKYILGKRYLTVAEIEFRLCFH